MHFPRLVRSCGFLVALLIGLGQLPAAVGPNVEAYAIPAATAFQPAPPSAEPAADSFSQPDPGYEAPAPASAMRVYVYVHVTAFARAWIYVYVGMEDPVNRWDPSGLWWITHDGREAVAEPNDTLSGLASIVFGDATKWLQFDYEGNPRDLRVGDRIDISQWGVPYKERYQRVQDLYGLIDVYAENLVMDYHQLSQELDNPLPDHEKIISDAFRRLGVLSQGEGRTLGYSALFEGVLQGGRPTESVIDEIRGAADFIGWGCSFMTLDDELVLPITLRRASDTAGPVHRGMSPNDLYRRLAGNERQARFLGNSFKVGGAGLSLLGVYYASKDLREHAREGAWLEAGVDVTSIVSAGTAIYETAMVVGGRSVSTTLARANPVAALALITNTATQSAVSDIGDYAYWKPVRKQTLGHIDKGLRFMTDAWDEIFTTEREESSIKRFSGFTNAVEALLRWRQDGDD